MTLVRDGAHLVSIVSIEYAFIIFVSIIHSVRAQEFAASGRSYVCERIVALLYLINNVLEMVKLVFLCCHFRY